MPKCPSCNKDVYFAERKTSLGKDWHRNCLKCEKCKKVLDPGRHAERDGKPYCNNPCYSALFGPGGCGRGGAESFNYAAPTEHNPETCQIANCSCKIKNAK